MKLSFTSALLKGQRLTIFFISVILLTTCDEVENPKRELSYDTRMQDGTLTRKYWEGYGVSIVGSPLATDSNVAYEIQASTSGDSFIHIKLVPFGLFSVGDEVTYHAAEQNPKIWFVNAGYGREYVFDLNWDHDLDKPVDSVYVEWSHDGINNFTVIHKKRNLFENVVPVFGVTKEETRGFVRMKAIHPDNSFTYSDVIIVDPMVPVATGSRGNFSRTKEAYVKITHYDREHKLISGEFYLITENRDKIEREYLNGRFLNVSFAGFK